MWKSVLAVWLSSALAIAVAIYFTHDMRCLWFLFIPTFVDFISKADFISKDDSESEDKK